MLFCLRACTLLTVLLERDESQQRSWRLIGATERLMRRPTPVSQSGNQPVSQSHPLPDRARTYQTGTCALKIPAYNLSPDYSAGTAGTMTAT
jgi:hypothetical protein